MHALPTVRSNLTPAGSAVSGLTILATHLTACMKTIKRIPGPASTDPNFHDWVMWNRSSRLTVNFCHGSLMAACLLCLFYQKHAHILLYQFRQRGSYNTHLSHGNICFLPEEEKNKTGKISLLSSILLGTFLSPKGCSSRKNVPTMSDYFVDASPGVFRKCVASLPLASSSQCTVSVHFESYCFTWEQQHLMYHQC